ncbi:MAG: LemA family protein [Acidobacteriota bacterium]
MKKTTIGCLVVAGVLALTLLILVGSAIGRYNTLVTQRESIRGAWAQVENVLQRRANLIPNLVETVKGYAAQEKQIFQEVADARSRLIGGIRKPSGMSPQEAAAANAGLTSALGRLLAISEAYPDLKSNQNFIRLQDELAGSENRITTERRRYNEAVRAYNTSLMRFPTSLIARTFNFTEEEYFEAEEGAKQVPKVEF